MPLNMNVPHLYCDVCGNKLDCCQEITSQMLNSQFQPELFKDAHILVLSLQEICFLGFSPLESSHARFAPCC